MKKLLLLAACFLTVHIGMAQVSQERARMEKERQEIQQELQQIQSAYNKVKGQKKATIGQLTVLQRKLEIQDRLLGNINKEIRNINDDIYLSNVEINHLQAQLDTLKAQYARSVVYAYKNKSSYDLLNFIFSANSFNDALKRVAYLKSYRSYRQQQVNSIVETQTMIRDRKMQLMGKQTQKKSALQNQQHQMVILEDQKKEKDAVVARLKSQEKDLSKQLAVRKRHFRELNNQIMAVIRRDMANARKKADADAAAARKSSAAGNTAATSTPSSSTRSAAPRNYVPLNARESALNASFKENHGRLPWPVDNGYVSVHFGVNKIGGLEINSPCITIATPSESSAVKAVFDGEVSAVSNAGDGIMVMLKHGNYYTVYSTLSSASVSKGDKVSRGQVIGHTGASDEGSGGQFDFYIMVDMKNVNPEPWLNRH